jgi:pimeloyl-ACP methyl ester carboxylesterase
MDVLYLHGFASSSQSSKAAFFSRHLRPHGIALRTPDFNEPDFNSLTVTRMIEHVGRALGQPGGAPAVLIGSSLGGLVAVQAALRWPERIGRMVLLAPAVDLRAEHMGQLGDRGLDQWKATGKTMVFHYGFGRLMPVGYELFADAQQYDTLNAAVDVPTLVFQGRRDSAVNPQVVEQWASARPNVQLHMLDDDHQLLASLDYIWTVLARFLGLPPS